MDLPSFYVSNFFTYGKEFDTEKVNGIYSKKIPSILRQIKVTYILKYDFLCSSENVHPNRNLTLTYTEIYCFGLEKGKGKPKHCKHVIIFSPPDSGHSILSMLCFAKLLSFIFLQKEDFLSFIYSTMFKVGGFFRYISKAAYTGFKLHRIRTVFDRYLSCTLRRHRRSYEVFCVFTYLVCLKN